MKKKKRRDIPSNLHPARLAGRLMDIEDDFTPLIAFVRILGRACQIDPHSAPDDSGVWLAIDIEEKINDIRTEIDLIGSALRKLAASL